MVNLFIHGRVRKEEGFEGHEAIKWMKKMPFFISAKFGTIYTFHVLFFIFRCLYLSVFDDFQHSLTFKNKFSEIFASNVQKALFAKKLIFEIERFSNPTYQ
jgi:hypothetical protein